jgi:proteasome component ECM29
MNDIWAALVKDSSATIDKHFDAIMDDLLASILGKEWRVRQACCAAIADLVQGRSIEKVSLNIIHSTPRYMLTIDSMRNTSQLSGISASKFSTTSKKLYALPPPISPAY